MSSRQVLKAYKKLEKEMDKQLHILIPAAAVVLWKEFGWRRTRIMRRLATTSKVCSECAELGPEESLLQMLEKETGIELQLTGYRSYHEFQYLDAERYKGKRLSNVEMVYMYGQMLKWIAPQLLAGLCLALYRDERFGAERLGRFISCIDQKRKLYKEEIKRYEQELHEITKIRINDLFVAVKSR